MTGQIVFFTGDGEGEHPGPTYFSDFVPMSFGELTVLLITCIWYAYLFQFLAWLRLLKSILPTLTRKFVEK